MVDLAFFKNKGTLDYLENGLIESPLRPYLGMSQLGHSCNRYLWYSFRWAFKNEFSKRQLRLFNRGDREEEVIIAELEKIGIRCYGAQEEMITAFGHCKGHNDGRCIGVIEAPKTEHLLEIKTMNDKNFKKLQKEGVELSKPIYFAQCQSYMYNLKLTRTLFMAVNKNDDSYYIERIKENRSFGKELNKKAEYIITELSPPRKPFSSTWYECKWCSANQICHHNYQINKSCRTCESVEIHKKGIWKCGKYNVKFAPDQQRIGCDQYELLNCLKG